MTFDVDAFCLYLISDRKLLPEGTNLPEIIEQALIGGVRALQLREKDLPSDELYRLALELKSLADRHGAKLLINDRIDIAMAVGAGGVHLGEHSLPTDTARRILGQQAIIGRSTHRVEDIVQAAAQGADFVTFSPIYFTPSKAPYGQPQGLEPLRAACSASRLPVLALGGIRQDRIREVRSAGAAGVALISAILTAIDPASTARSLLKEMY